MNTILHAIKLYPQDFIDTLKARAETTPNEINKVNHKFLAHWIEISSWELVADLLGDPLYQRPLEGVIFTLNKYSSIDRRVWHDIAELYEEGELV